MWGNDYATRGIQKTFNRIIARRHQMTRRKGIENVHTLVAPEIYRPSKAGTAAQIEQTCTWCGEKLWTFPWNSKGDIVTCQNDKCPAFKRPVSK